MNLRPHRQDPPDINLTPLIDVVFLLLIFFMVSTTFERHSELSIELPEARAEPEEPKKGPIEVAIDQGGNYYVNGRQLVNTQRETLERALQEAAEGRESPQILIDADAGARHQAVVTLMAAASELGLLRLSFSYRKSENDGAQGNGAKGVATGGAP